MNHTKAALGILLKRALSTFERTYRDRLGSLLRLNTPFSERWATWQAAVEAGKDGFDEAVDLSLFADASEDATVRLLGAYGDRGRLVAVSSGRWNAMTTQDRLAAVNALATSPLFRSNQIRDSRMISVDFDLYRVYAMLVPETYSLLGYDPDTPSTFEDSMNRYGIFRHPPLEEDCEISIDSSVHDVGAAAVRSSRTSINSWRTSIEPWSDFIESARRTWGDHPRLFCVAAIGAGIRSKEVRARGYSDLFDVTQPLVERVRFARLQPSSLWWKDSLKRASSEDDKFLVLLLIMTWGSGKLVRATTSKIDEVLKTLSQSNWSQLLSVVERTTWHSRDRRQPISGMDEEFIRKIPSTRMKSLLMLRLPKALASLVLVDLANSFDGSEPDIGSFIASRGLAEAYRDPKIWKDLAPFFGRIGRDIESFTGDLSARNYHFFRGSEPMPGGFVQMVNENPLAYPFVVLETAEISAGRRPASMGETLGSLSDGNGWFD